MIFLPHSSISIALSENKSVKGEFLKFMLKEKSFVVSKYVKRWWTASIDGKINLVMRYGSKPLEFAKGKNAIELASEIEVADVLLKVKEPTELDAQIEKKRSLADEWHKRTSEQKEQKNVYGLTTFFVLHCVTKDCVNY